MSNKIETKKIRSVLTDYQKARNLAAHVWRHFKEDRCFDEAASLSYTSLLSLVPLLAVAFGMISSVPAFERWSEQLKNFISSNLLPTSGAQVQEYLNQFIGSATGLTLTGFIVLIVTALLLMVRIERSFNRIWRVPSPRTLLNKILVYWAVLTLGPIALGVATALSAQPLISLLGGGVMGATGFLDIGVFLLTWAAFLLLFLLVPNTRVQFAHAAVGALVSTILFTLAKKLFVVYVSRASFSLIYGALASIPIFLIWLYIVWGVILLGASMASALTSFSDRRSEWRWPHAWEFLLVFRLLGHFYHAQLEGRSLSTAQLLDSEPGVPSNRLQRILQQLMKERLVTEDHDQCWVLKRDLGHYTLRDLYLAGEFHLPIGKELPVPTRSPWDSVFLDILNRENVNMDRSLESLYEAAGEDKDQ